VHGKTSKKKNLYVYINKDGGALTRMHGRDEELWLSQQPIKELWWLAHAIGLLTLVAYNET
jgi:hypothetical protein